MVRSLAKLVSLFVLAVAAGTLMYWMSGHNAAEQERARLANENLQLQEIVTRLTSERRVAEVLVMSQKPSAQGLQTSLLLVEYARDGSQLPPKSFTIAGNVVHVDALVIKFDHGLVKRDDPLRGHSIALFYRLFGEQQTPEHAFIIDTPNQIPDFYRGTNPEVATMERSLWSQFWQLATDPNLAAEKGVRVANGQGVWWKLDPDRLYTVSIETDGGINEKSEPIPPIYRDALHRPGA